MSRSASSRGVSVTTSSGSTSSGRAPGARRRARRRAARSVRRSRAHAGPRPGSRPSSSSCATTIGGALLGRLRLGVDHDLGVVGLLVRVVDAGEALDLAGERLRVEALHVAARALLDARPSTYTSTNGPNSSTISRAAWRVSSYGEIAAAMTAPPWRVSREATQPMRSMFVSRSSFENPRPFERCVRTVSPSRYSTTCAALVELGADEVRDRGLAGAGEPGEPEGEAAAGDRGPTRDARGVDVARVIRALLRGVPWSPRWMPHSSLSEPAQRPARSSSSGPRRPGAGDAADRTVARVVQRVVRDVVRRRCSARRPSRSSRRAAGSSRRRSARSARPSARPPASATGRGGCPRSRRRTGSSAWISGSTLRMWQQRSGSRSQRFGPSCLCCSATVMISGRIRLSP